MIDKKVLERALGVLDSQYSAISRVLEEDKERQTAYYVGQRAMLEFILSNSYENGVFVNFDENGKHYVGYCGESSKNRKG